MQTIMKKFVSVMLILVVIFFIVGCSTEKTNDEQGSAIKEISDAKQDSSDLSSGELDNLDKDMEDFNW